MLYSFLFATLYTDASNICNINHNGFLKHNRGFKLCGFIFNKQDRLRVQLSKFDNFKPVGKDECCKIINKWKLENMEDRDYRHMLDVGMRQICDYNVFPVYIHIPKSEYIVINLVTEKNVNIINILDRKNNTNYIDKVILKYHVFSVQYNYNPNYYELKTNNRQQFLSAVFLNLLDANENKLIQLKKKDYMEYLEQDSRNKDRKEKKGNAPNRSKTP